MRVLLVAGLLFACGCQKVNEFGQKAGVVDPDTPETPNEAVFHQQLAVLQEVRTVVASVERKETEPVAAVAKLNPLRDRVRLLQERYEANGQTIQDFRPSLKNTYSSLLKELTRDQVGMKTGRGLSGQSGSGDVSREVEEILKLVGPKRSDEKTQK